MLTPRQKIEKLDALAAKFQASGDMYSYGVLLTLSAAIEQNTTAGLLLKCQQHAKEGLRIAYQSPDKLN